MDIDPKRAFRVNDIVEGKWQMLDGSTKWYEGQIKAVLKNGTFQIEWNDGKTTEFSKKFLRLKRSTEAETNQGQASNRYESQR